jgi:hypothetical protein
MAGGTFTGYNKVLPGVYINVQSREAISVSAGERGTVAIGKALSWGASGEVVSITPGEPLEPYIGYDITNENALFLREMMKGSDVTSAPNKILLYRLPGTGGVAATAAAGSLSIEAKYEGVRGNDISIMISADPDNASLYTIQTIVDGSPVDSQTFTELSQIVSNDWVNFSTSGAEISTTAGTALTGGTDPTVATADYAAFLTAIEPYQFDIIAYDGSESTVIAAFTQFVNRMNESVGLKCQAVMSLGDNVSGNNKYVIDVKNGVTLSDGTELSATQAVWWVAGSEAGARYNQSLTYAQYPGAVSANPKLTDAQAEAAINAGKLCFVDTFGIVKVCTDINSKTTVTPKEGAEFKKNRVMRVINQFCNDLYEEFSANYIGKVDNNDTGRSLLRGWIVGYLNGMQSNNGIQNFVADDVTVAQGQTIDSVIVNVAIQPVDAIEKIYCTVTVTANALTVAVA